MDATTNTISRRELSLYCVGGVAIAFAPIAAASMAKPADKGELAFDLWKATYHAINTSPMEDGDNGTDAIRWNTIDRLENDILNDTTATARAAERKMWVALAHDGSLSNGADHHAVTSEDLRHFLRQGDALDWNVRLHVAAIATLRRALGKA